eukprot:5551941-Lingulodinium_polyedra.AAC.1
MAPVGRDEPDDTGIHDEDLVEARRPALCCPQLQHQELPATVLPREEHVAPAERKGLANAKDA